VDSRRSHVFSVEIEIRLQFDNSGLIGNTFLKVRGIRLKKRKVKNTKLSPIQKS